MDSYGYNDLFTGGEGWVPVDSKDDTYLMKTLIFTASWILWSKEVISIRMNL